MRPLVPRVVADAEPESATRKVAWLPFNNGFRSNGVTDKRLTLLEAANELPAVLDLKCCISHVDSPNDTLNK